MGYWGSVGADTGARNIEKCDTQGGETDCQSGASKKQVGGDHYVNMGVQPWDAMKSWLTPEQFHGFLHGNAIKYLARCHSKGGIEDLRKARHYLDKLIEEVGDE